MVDYAKYRVVDLKKLLLARQLPTNGLKAALVQRLTQSDAIHVSIEEVVNGRVKPEIPSTASPPQSGNTIGNAKRQNLHDAMDTLKNIPGFTPTTAGHMMLKQENSYTSSQIQNPQPTPTAHNASQSSPYTNLDAVQFSENDSSDDDNIDLDANYDLPISQSSFTNSQPQSQPGVHSQYQMSPSTQNYGRAPPSSSFYQGYPKMTQDPYAPATPTQRYPLTTLQNNQTLPPSSFKVHKPGNTKVQIKSERSTSDSALNSSLTDFSTFRATPQSFTSASSLSTNIKTPHVGRPSKSLANVSYLSYYQMEQMYYTSGQDPQSDKEKLARRQWLAKLGVDINPFNFVFIDPLQRDKVEVHWALKSPEIRRDIEKKAIRLKQPYSKREVPLRLAPFALRTPVPIKLVGPVPLSFDELEQRYFNIPQRKRLAYHDLIPERLGWLKELGLDDPRYLPLSQTALERQVLNNLYDEKPRVERRAIEAKAKYINAMLDPPNPSWVTLEQTYEIYPASAFTAYAAYLDKRRQWLQQLGLDIVPFCYKTLELSEGNMQGMEVAWSAMTEVERNKVLETAKIIKEDSNPVVDSWPDFEHTWPYEGLFLQKQLVNIVFLCLMIAYRIIKNL
ncbi:hypothetical protein OCU04_005986 [Sclerotinia nivalis]|uniref:SAP domain-containing protein n=1 Tax=Sclerotinia nivalis TaxID=352851 RepID=A0A9X0AMY5_9HELO|nr:hypothetical protein OCU04_005986 [Sclerotinia nivalis]